jgi:hypothetical protein
MSSWQQFLALFGLGNETASYELQAAAASPAERDHYLRRYVSSCSPYGDKFLCAAHIIYCTATWE